MHVGLIVGIGPAATDFYYRSIIASVAARGVDLELTMVHADAPTLLRNQASGDTEAQVAIYRRLTDRLRVAGARAVAVTSIAGHFSTGRALVEDGGAEAVLLGGTDLGLAFAGHDPGFRTFDCAAAHASAIAEVAAGRVRGGSERS